MNLMRRFRAAVDKLRLRKAVMTAEEMHASDGGRYYVLPNGDATGKLIVMDRRNFRRLRQKGYIKREKRIRDAVEMCFYATADRSGKRLFDDEGLAALRKKYLAWCEFSRDMKKAEKKAGKKKTEAQQAE